MTFHLPSVSLTKGFGFYSSAKTVTMAAANAPVMPRTLEPVVNSAPTKTCMDHTATTVRIADALLS